MTKKRLMLIDGNSLLFRAFHALPLLKNNDGVYTNGVYGFLTMFYKITDEYKPEYISVAFDRKAPTFRHKEYKLYKAGRMKMPDELGMQFPILKDVLDCLNTNRIELDGFEADDLIGILSRIGEKNGLEVIVVTGDKDYLQLATDKVKILITKKGISNIDIYDEKEMIDKYGITPKQFIDLKGLMGDKSDNIPGVPGVGEKTGIKLLKQFESIDGVYENIDKVPGKKLKEKLIENKQQAFMSKRLAKIITDMPLDLDIEDMKVIEPDFEELYKIYQKLGFKRFLERIDKNIVLENKIELDTNFSIVSTEKEIENIIEKIKQTKHFTFKFAIEGKDSLRDKILGMSIKTQKDKSYFIDFEDEPETMISKFKQVFEDDNIEKFGHYIKNDILVLFRYGLEIRGIAFDTVIGQYLINPSQTKYSLKNLADEYLNAEIKDEEDLLGKGRKKKALSDIELEKVAEFFCNKLNVIFRIKEKIEQKVCEYEMHELFKKIEMPLIEVLARMEYNGFEVDINKLSELGLELDEKINNLTECIHGLSGEQFNINSPKQLGEVLFEKLGLPVIKKTKTGYSTSAEVLHKLEDHHEIIEKILEYRQVVKIKSTYVDGLMSLINKSTGRVHSSFNQTITTTGRISSTEPNLQNIPIKTEEGRKIRKVFIADEDYVLVDADYSQIELRVLAHITNDSNLKEAFFTGEDIHTKTASEVFKVDKEKVTSLMRSRAKAVNFGIIYGISDYGLSRDLDISRKEAKKYIESYLDNYPTVRQYMDDIVDYGKHEGYVKTIFNRRRYLPELKSRNYNVRSFGERMAMNTPIQGSAADIIKIAMVNVYKELKKRKMKSKLVLQVHDELIIEAHKNEVEEVKKILSNLMENAVELNIPLKVEMETGESWYDTK